MSYRGNRRGAGWRHNHRGRGHPRYFHTPGALRDEADGNLPSSRGNGQNDHNPSRPPPGLRGRDIGMWYARRGKIRKEHAGRLRVTLDDRSVRNIEDVLDRHGPRSAPTPDLSSAGTSQGAGIADVSRASGEYDHRLGDEDTTADFMIEYSENLLQNSQSSEENFVQRHCSLKDDAIKNADLKYELKACHERNSSLLDFRKRLPAFRMQKELLEVVSANQVVVISGETGCGKTTQVPQFILDDMIERGRGSTCNIICTQPRRISAISVAERVAEERGESLGHSVGYSIRLANVLPRQYASTTYCTTGILLRRLRSDKYLTSYSHIIVDEVHERDIQTDFLLILLRDLLPRRPDMKVILMSATLNADHFSEYYHNAAMFNIPGFTFPVTEYYLEDIIDTLRYEPPSYLRSDHTPNYRQRYSTEAAKKKQELTALQDWAAAGDLSTSQAGIDTILSMNHDKIHPLLVSRLVEHICRTKQEGAILVFLPGWTDITDVNKQLTSSLAHVPVNIIPLHSLMPTREQKEIFQRPPPGVRKIVLATNIAETSITIDDIVYVVNAGKIKITDFITDRNMATLDSRWVSKANSRQRRGRAGRVQAGVCYHLYTRYHESTLEEYQKPEIIRTRLENVCLDVKLLGQGKVEPFLLKAMDPPSAEAIETSIELLKTLNAFDNEERLTPLGYHLARIPLDPHTGKMVLMAAMFSCLDPVLSIAACLNFKDPFHIPMDKQKQVDLIRKRMSRGTDSDLLMYYYAVKGWEEAHNKSVYCYDNFISSSTISMITKMKGQFADLLHELKFISSANTKDHKANRNSGNVALIRAILCAGLYPNVAKVNRFGRNEVKLSTRTERRVNIHPKSVNILANLDQKGQWVIYYEMIKLNGNICVMDSTLIPAFPIMFFGGELRLEIKGDDDLVPKYEAVVVNDWINFQCEWKYAELITKLRGQLNEVLESKITNPQLTNWDRNSKEGATLQAIVDLLATDRTSKTGQASGGAI